MKLTGREYLDIMNNKDFKQSWEEMDRIEPLTPPSNQTNVINPDKQRSLEECQDLDRDAILKRIDFFNEEIAVLENRIQPHDTGHIKTAICVLKARKQEIEDRRDGHPGWLNEYLIGGKS